MLPIAFGLRDRATIDKSLRTENLFTHLPLKGEQPASLSACGLPVDCLGLTEVVTLVAPR